MKCDSKYYYETIRTAEWVNEKKKNKGLKGKNRRKCRERDLVSSRSLMNKKVTAVARCV